LTESCTTWNVRDIEHSWVTVTFSRAAMLRSAPGTGKLWV